MNIDVIDCSRSANYKVCMAALGFACMLLLLFGTSFPDFIILFFAIFIYLYAATIQEPAYYIFFSDSAPETTVFHLRKFSIYVFLQDTNLLSSILSSPF